MAETPIEAINEFYRLKNHYELEYFNKYIQPIILSKRSKKEKRIDFSRLPPNECINCNRNVKTNFSITSNLDEGVKIYQISCGDIQEPCPLDIQIRYFIRDPMDKTISNGLKEIEQIKFDIIKEKNNSLFFNKSGVVETFDQLTEKLKTNTENTGFIIETNILRNNNPTKHELLKKKMDEFSQGSILPFKRMIKEYSETGRETIVKEAVTFYEQEMQPKLKEIQELKYDINMVEFNESSKMYTLIQLPKSIENNEFSFVQDDAILKFVKGTTSKGTTSKGTTKGTKKTKPGDLKPKNVTKKNRGQKIEAQN
jgi:hypothetical protein